MSTCIQKLFPAKRRLWLLHFILIKVVLHRWRLWKCFTKREKEEKWKNWQHMQIRKKIQSSPFFFFLVHSWIFLFWKWSYSPIKWAKSMAVFSSYIYSNTDLSLSLAHNKPSRILSPLSCGACVRSFPFIKPLVQWKTLKRLSPKSLALLSACHALACSLRDIS